MKSNQPAIPRDVVMAACLHALRAVKFGGMDDVSRCLLIAIATGNAAYGVVAINDDEFCRSHGCNSDELYSARKLCAKQGYLDYWPGRTPLYRLTFPPEVRTVFWRELEEQIYRDPQPES